MTSKNPAQFTFVKLTVADIGSATRFFEEGLGMTHSNTIETDAFCEHIMTGRQGSTTIVLFHHKDGRPIEHGNAHGPIGMMTRDLEADLARATEAGARQQGMTASFGKTRVAIVTAPEGHQIEMMQIAERDAT